MATPIEQTDYEQFCSLRDHILEKNYHQFKTLDKNFWNCHEFSFVSFPSHLGNLKENSYYELAKLSGDFQNKYVTISGRFFHEFIMECKIRLRIISKPLASEIFSASTNISGIIAWDSPLVFSFNTTEKIEGGEIVLEIAPTSIRKNDDGEKIGKINVVFLNIGLHD